MIVPTLRALKAGKSVAKNSASGKCLKLCLNKPRKTPPRTLSMMGKSFQILLNNLVEKSLGWVSALIREVRHPQFKGKMLARDLIGLLTEKPRVFRTEVIPNPNSCDNVVQKATQSRTIATV
jgi:hypothetical protein